MKSKEAVDHPDHYNKGIETIDYIESWKMDFNQGNVIKYVSRYSMKGGPEDLKESQMVSRKNDRSRGKKNVVNKQSHLGMFCWNHNTPTLNQGSKSH